MSYAKFKPDFCHIHLLFQHPPILTSPVSFLSSSPSHHLAPLHLSFASHCPAFLHFLHHIFNFSQNFFSFSNFPAMLAFLLHSPVPPAHIYSHYSFSFISFLLPVPFFSSFLSLSLLLSLAFSVRLLFLNSLPLVLSLQRRSSLGLYRVTLQLTQMDYPCSARD